MARRAAFLALLGALLFAPVAQAVPPTEPSLRRAAPASTLVHARPADDARAIERGLARAVKAGRLTRSEAAHYRVILGRARATLPGLTATRRATLANVLYLVRLQAPALRRPRALAVFSMLDENARFLKRHALPASGTDVTGPDGIVYRSGWGYGLQFHPLANAAALNNHVAAGRDGQAAKLAAALAARAVPRRGHGRVWEYYFPYGGGSAPWVSGMAQAVGAQAMARAGRKGAARWAFRSIPGRLVQPLEAGPWIRLYAFSTLVVLNAQLQTILSLREYAERTGDADASKLANRLAAAARALLPRFDTGYWSRYSLGRESPLSYHRYVVQLLGRLGRRTGQPIWEKTRVRFDRYTHEAPIVKAGSRKPPFYPWPVDGFRDRVVIGFWVSKMSTVTVRVGGEQKPLGLLAGGWHRISWSPGRREPREFRPALDAVDLAGNKQSGPLAPIVLKVDVTPPVARAHVEGRRLTWRVTDAETPWVTLRLRLTRAGVLKVVDLGRYALRGSRRLPIPRGTWQAVLAVRDSSGNRTRVALGAVPRPQ